MCKAVKWMLFGYIHCGIGLLHEEYPNGFGFFFWVGWEFIYFKRSAFVFTWINTLTNVYVCGHRFSTFRNSIIYESRKLKIRKLLSKKKSQILLPFKIIQTQWQFAKSNKNILISWPLWITVHFPSEQVNFLISFYAEESSRCRWPVSYMRIYAIGSSFIFYSSAFAAVYIPGVRTYVRQQNMYIYNTHIKYGRFNDVVGIW